MSDNEKVLGPGAVLQQVPDPMNPESRLSQDGAVTDDARAAEAAPAAAVPDLGAPDALPTPPATPEEHTQ